MNQGPGFQPDFSSSHSVVLDVPITDVFSTIGTSAGHERVTRLSGLCSGFELLKRDTVALPHSTSLTDTHVRTLPPANLAESEPGLELATRNLPRQFFTLKETVPMLFGLIHTDVSLSGTLTWDDATKATIYETKTDSGILITVWKSRKFEEVEGGKTRVSETIQGKCPFWIKSVVQSQSTTGHVAHMELYHTLF